MTRRYRDALSTLSQLGPPLGYGLRSQLAGYGLVHLRADLMAGLVVGVVALPLSMALAIASGVAPQHGLYTAIVAGAVCALLGGTRTQVTGPTAAFVAVLVPIVEKFGLGGLLVAGFMAGGIQFAMGLVRLGRLITFIPHPVTTGFTAGIAVVIASIQIKDLFGLQPARAADGFVDRLQVLWQARATALGAEILIATFTLALLIIIPRFIKRVPASLLALTAASLLAFVLGLVVPGFHVATIATRFSSVIDGQLTAGIPPLPPLPLLPWNLPGPGGAPLILDLATIRALIPSAFAIAMLGAIESLLSAVIADGLSGSRHEPNSELMALGIANMVCPFFGGIAATGAIARTATNIRAGARSPLAAVFHALFVLACTVALAPVVGYLPMAAMAAMLVIVAHNMSEAGHFAHLVRVAPRSDTVVLLVCFFLTVFFDMVLAVGVGVVLAALLFMRRMAEITNTRLDVGTMAKMDLPDDILLYEIAGPLFFGAAEKAVGALQMLERRATTIILYMAQVPAIDATGLVALESVLAKLRRSGLKVILTGLRPAVEEIIVGAGIKREPGRLAFAPDLEAAFSIAILHSARQPELPGAAPHTASRRP
jgi:sulfate permease, SulP family